MANRAIAVVGKIEGTSKRFPVVSKKAFSSSLQKLGLGSGPFDDHPRSIFDNKVRNLDDALYVFHEMLHTRPLPSTFSFTPLLDYVSKIKHFSCSIDCFKQMCAAGVPVNKRTACIVIDCYSQLHQTKHGFTVLGRCFKQGINVPPDTTWTCNTLINGFILEDNTHEAERLFKKLITNRLCEPNLVTYNTMITGLCKVGNSLVAVGLVRLMDGRGCKPTVDTYNIIIHTLCMDLMIDDAFKLFREMVFDNSVPPNLATYNSFITMLSKLGHWDEVCRMMQQMEAERISPDINMFNVIVDALCMQGNVKHAEVVTDIMYDSFNMRVDTTTVNSLIHGYCLWGQLKKAMADFNYLVKGYSHLKPNLDTYNIMFYAYCRHFHPLKSFCLYTDLLTRGGKLKPNMLTHCILSMGSSLAAHIPQEDEEESQLLDPNILLLYHQHLLGGVGNTTYEDALALFRFIDANDSKMNSDIAVYNVLIGGAIKSGKFDAARRLFHELSSVKGLKPNVNTYQMMIAGFRERGLLKDARRLLFGLRKFFKVTSVDFDDVLIRGYLNNKKMSFADVLKVLREREGRSNAFF